MPELPDLTLYREALERRIVGETLERVRLLSPSLLRSVEPPLAEVEGLRVAAVERFAKRLVIALEGERFLVFHLMIAGRFRWRPDEPRGAGRRLHAVLRFSSGCLVLSEASTRKRASLHLVRGRPALAELDPGGVEVMELELEAFREVLLRENHTLKRTLTDPRLFAGIGNAYSDEILHRARLSPLKWSRRLDEEEIRRLHAATRDTLREWTERLRAQTGERFPEKVTAFRPEMAVHGRYRQPCPDCGAPVQRIAYAENETCYCAACQTGGRLLADRALSQLLKKDWPRTLEELEERRPGAGSPRGGGGPAARRRR